MQRHTFHLGFAHHRSVRRLAKGEVANAVTEFERINTIYKRVPEVQYRLALAHLRNGNSAQAILSLNRAVSLDPNFDEAVLLLADLNIREGDLAAAITSLKQLVDQRPQSTQAQRATHTRNYLSSIRNSVRPSTTWLVCILNTWDSSTRHTS